MSLLQYTVPEDLWSRLVVTLCLISLGPLGYCIYNVYFHPLSKFPGPVLWGAARLPYMRAAWSGRFPYIVQDLHRKYGEVVRIAPDELSFAHSDAWGDIYSNRGARSAFPKSKTWHESPPEYPSSLFNKIDFKDHSRARRAMDPAFTERAVAQQEPLVQKYVDMLIERLNERVSASADKSTIINVVEWFNFLTFDITGDLGFGESFHCLEEVQYHEWMSFTFSTIKVTYLMISLRHYPLLFKYLMRLIPASAKKKQEEHWNRSVEKANQRLKLKTDRPDIISFLERKGDKENKEGLSVGEIHANASLLIVAGSETTVTVLMGITNHLLKNASSLMELTTELRASFQDMQDISFAAVKNLPYLNAVISEGLRMCNPNPIGLMRISPPEGGTVAGHFVPGNTFVAAHTTTLMFSPSHFHEPYAWRPERWLEAATTDPASPYHNDDRKCVRAFGLGPQSCIGEPLARAEMRLVLAKLLWTFDLERADGPHAEVVWENQKVFAVVEKHPLDVRLVARK